MYKLKSKPEDFIVEEIPLAVAQESGEYTYFILEKKDYDTEKAIKRISEEFGMPRKNFSYAGNKDRNAITSQLCSARGKISDRKFPDFRIKVCGFGPSPISLGDLKGNRFMIVARSLDEGESPLFRESTINYFDDQRFGKHNLEIGIFILKKEFRKACGLIDLESVREHLKATPNDYIGAIKKVPYKIIKLYLHSVQSYLWNEAASEHIKSITKRYRAVGYSKGTLIFPDEKIENISIPLIAFDTEFTDKKIEKSYETIMGKLSISPRDFIIRQMPDITPLGGERDLISDIKSLSIGVPEDDELDTGKKKITIEFELGKGSYATAAIKDMFCKTSYSPDA